MSEIKKLIERLCPEGVEYKRLGDITEILRGRRLTKKELTDNAEYPVYHGGIEPIGYYSHHNRPANRVMIINVGASAGTVGYCNKSFWSSDGCYCIDKSELLSDRYLYYVLSKNQLAFVSKVRHAGIPTLDSKVIANFEIPVPPIEVQSKIVEILDNFTELEAELEAKLEAELEARRKQYEYYRNQLLTFDKVGGARFDVKWMKLGEISMYAKERIDGNLLSTENYVGVENLLKDKGGKTSSSSVPSGNAIKFKPGDILIGNIRPYLKKIWLANIIGGTNGDVLCIRVSRNDLVSSDYLYKCLSSDSFFNYDNSHAKGGKMPRGDKKAVMEYSIPVPPLSEQKRIVSILDRFEALTTDLQSGLPAEIEARRKQYEYYREKLLTFKRKTA